MMQRLYLIVVLTVLSGVVTYAQEDEVMSVLGVNSPEEADPEEFERMSDLLVHPLRINLVSESRLIASGLLTRYQAASLIDYRRRHGNIMSYTELAALDGFNDEVVSRLRPFLSLECYSLHDPEKHIQNDVALKAASKLAGTQYSWNYGLKYRIRTDRFTFALASSKSYSSTGARPDAYSGSAVYDFRRFRGRIAVGDFNARFGQGLALWSGTFMNSLNSPDAFMKKPSGISETWSFTGSTALTGVAGSMSFSHFTLTLLAAVPGLKTIIEKPKAVRLMPATNLMWQGKYGSVSFTHVAEMNGFKGIDFRIPQMRTSGDAAFCFKGVNLFGELAYDWVSEDIHATAGTDFPIGEIGRAAALLKYIPSKFNGTAAQHGAVSSFALKSRKCHSLTLSAEALRYVGPKDDDVLHSIQAKFLADWRFSINNNWETRLRVSERFRTWGNMTRTDIRTDVIYVNGPLNLSGRLNYLKCVSHAFVGYAEQGYKTERFSTYLRQGVFFVDDWEDRIYVYERDAPGSFNVPAMYGRGWFANVVTSARVSNSVRLYFRASYTGYCFMPDEKRKPGKAELRIQLVLRYL